MKVVALISGGKDSCYNMMQCVSEGHEIVALANLRPKDCDELDSYMYQTVGHQAIDMYAEAMSLPLYRHTIKGSSKQLDKYYEPTTGDEVEDLFELLQMVMNEQKIDAVSVGAILSDYQRVRVENVCQRLGLTSLAYLWRRDQDELLREMINCEVDAIIIKVAALGLDPYKHLGKTLSEIYPHMLKMSDQFGLNICGEGGEFESLTCDCPLFQKKIIIDEVEIVIHSYDPFAPVGYLNIKKLHLQDKLLADVPLHKQLEKLPLKRGSDLQKSLMSEANPKVDIVFDNVITDAPPPIPDDIEVHYRKTDTWFYISNVISYNNSSSSIQDQTQLAVTKLKDTIRCLDVSLKNIVSVCLYVRNMSDFAAVNSVYKTLFDINPPVRACLQVCLSGNINLQLDCVGCIDNDIKSTLHVQSISHWASANIGPYSQAIMVDGKVYVAGQIALCPASMVIIEGGVVPQACLSLRHTARILAVISPGCNFNNVLLCICYVTNPAFIPIVQREWKKEVKMLSITQFGELDDIKNNRNGLVQCIVIPALPRKALVEWQVYASAELMQVSETRIKKSEDGFKVKIEVIHSTDTSDIFTCKAVIESTSNQIPVCKRLVRSLFEEYDKVLIQLKLDWKSVPLLRMFFPVSQFNYHQLYNDIYVTIRTLSDVTPVFSLIPVIALDSAQQLLSLCH